MQDEQNQQTSTETNTNPKRHQCRHIFTDGRRCASPSLRAEAFCYYHHTTRRPVQNLGQRRARQAHFDLPFPEDRAAIQLSIGEILRRIAANDLDPKRAGLLLYGLQIASSNLPRQAVQRNQRPASTGQEDPAAELVEELVEEIIVDAELGPIAPEREFIPPPERKSIVRILLDNLREAREDDEPDQPTWNESRTPEPNEDEEEEALEPTTLPQIQASAIPHSHVIEPNPCRSIEPPIIVSNLQSPPKGGERISHLPLCLRGSGKRKAGDDRAVRNGWRLRKLGPGFRQAGTAGPSA